MMAMNDDDGVCGRDRREESHKDPRIMIEVDDNDSVLRHAQ